jgi:hypothetical protein
LETTNFSAQGVLNLSERLESLVWTCLLPELFPEMFHWVEFRAVWRLRKQAYVLRDSQILGFMPACLIHLHDDQELAELLGYFLEENVHHVGVGPREQQSRHFPQGRAHGGVDIEILSDYLSGNPRTDPFWSPASTRVTYTPKSALILGHVCYRSGVFRIPVCQDLCYFLREFFLNSSWISFLALV